MAIPMRLQIMMHEMRYQWEKQSTRAAMAVAWAMPLWLVKWCAVRVCAHATMGEYSNQNVPELRFDTAMDRWEKQ